MSKERQCEGIEAERLDAIVNYNDIVEVTGVWHSYNRKEALNQPNKAIVFVSEYKVI